MQILLIMLIVVLLAFTVLLLALAKQHTPTLLYFGAQPEAERFYERNGCRKSLQSYQIDQPESR